METKDLVELVRKAQKGDDKAKQELYLDSSKSVYFLALKILRNKDDAEDITQDVFIAVYEKLPELKQPAAYYKWLNQITANKCVSFLRKKKPLPIDEQDILDVLDLEDEDDSPTPEKLFDDEETRRIIMEIIDELPDAQRICVMYRYFNQLSIEEIAAITGANEHTVKSRLMLARNKIRDAILVKEEQEGIRLHVLVPIMPVLMKALEDFQMPDGLTSQMWQKIAEGAGIAAGGGAAAAAANEAAKAGAKEAAKQGVKAKVIGGAAGAVAVAVIAAVILWPKPEPPAQVTPPPSSTPVVSQAPSSTPPPPTNGPIAWQDNAIETAVKAALHEQDPSYSDGDVAPNMLNRFERVYVELVGNTLSISFNDTRTVIDSFSDILDLSDLAHMKNLADFDLRGDISIEGIEVLGECEYLFNVHIENCSSITALPDLTKSNGIQKITIINVPLTLMPNMGKAKEVHIENCGISDLTPIGSMKNLSMLELIDIAASDVSPIANVSTLRSLSLIGMPVVDISPLAALTGLRTVTISNTEIADVSIFTNMPELTSLKLSDNQIADISPLAGMTQLKWLYLQGNPIADKSPLDGLRDTQIEID